MTVSDFSMLSKGAATVNAGFPLSQQHNFTYVVADEDRTNFHAFLTTRKPGLIIVMMGVL